MEDLSKKSKQKTCVDSPNVIFSQELGDGLTPCNSQDGVQTDLFGLPVSPVSRSASQGNNGERGTRDTSSPSSSGSSESASLAQSLANKFQIASGLDGSTEYRTHWKAKATPSGRRYFQLVASAHRTSVRDFGGWPTALARDYKGGCQGGRIRDGKLSTDNLDQAVQLTGNSPSGSDAVTGRPEESPPKLSLNPAFSLWLMGYPKEWMEAGQRAMARKKK